MAEPRPNSRRERAQPIPASRKHPIGATSKAFEIRSFALFHVFETSFFRGPFTRDA